MRFTDASVYPIEQSALPAAPSAVVALLRAHVTEARFAKIASVAERRTLDVVPVLDQLVDPHNISAILRSCDAFGVHRLHVVSHDRGFLGSHKVARGTDRWLDLVRHDEPEGCVRALHANGYRVFVADMQGEHTPESLAGVPKVAVVFGNERRGVSQPLRDLADGTYRVPMVGFVESLNVSVAAAVTLYTLTRAKARPLTGDERDEIMARLLMGTVHDAERVVEEWLSRDAAQEILG